MLFNGNPLLMVNKEHSVYCKKKIDNKNRKDEKRFVPSNTRGWVLWKQ